MTPHVPEDTDELQMWADLTTKSSALLAHSGQKNVFLAIFLSPQVLLEAACNMSLYNLQLTRCEAAWKSQNPVLFLGMLAHYHASILYRRAVRRSPSTYSTRNNPAVNKRSGNSSAAQNWASSGVFRSHTDTICAQKSNSSR